mmetsp:Transcript_8508/g.13261  ORF Transcript_8508/g.13261 Transcript_8508/m.13261 type:complete len:278 (-) Transcript_8508:50-883(-)
MNQDDSTWREYNVHGNADDEEDQPIDLFASSNADEDAYETIQYDYVDEEEDNNAETTKIKIRSETDYDKSTGMSVWKGSEVMCTYLRRHSDLIHNKKVLELGAGCGLCGLVCRMVLNPESVLITDGDHQVLKNLRYNAEELNGLKLVDDATNNIYSSSSASTTTDDARTISCPQLIWGKTHAIKFAKQYGTQDVIIATDCVYIPHSVPKLFETINELLNNNSGVFLFVNTCASACPMETVLSIANEFGFMCLDEEFWYHDDDREEKKHPVHVFRRRS